MSLVRARTANDRVKLAPDEGSDAGARPLPQPQPPAEPGVAADAGSTVEKCINCQFYDRRHAKPLDGKAPLWGQCRRHAPHLNPLTAKAYVIEGVWPLVRDDDWCGEWKILSRVVEDWIPDAAAAVVVEAPAADSSGGRRGAALVPAPQTPAVAAVGDS
jgi:hypothetical protein